MSSGRSVDERCKRCGLPMHRYALGDTVHEPTAVACANSIIGEIDRMLAKDDPDAREYVRQHIGTALTNLAFATDLYWRRLPKRTQREIAP